MANSARRWRSSSLKSGSPALTVWLAHTATSLTTSANGVPMAMFSVLVSTKPTAATVCENGETGGAEGGVVGSRFGCERTTETMPKVRAARAIRGRTDFFITVTQIFADTDIRFQKCVYNTDQSVCCQTAFPLALLPGASQVLPGST